MYGYSEYSPLSIKEILKRVSQEDIYEMVIGFRPVEHQYILSPFREDTNPDCYFEWYNGLLYFIDWGSGRKHMDCFNAVQAGFGLGFLDALKKVNHYFNLGLGTDRSKPVNGKLIEHTKRKHKPTKSRKEITFKSRSFSSVVDGRYWSKYEITREQLIEDNVFPTIWYRVYSRKLKQYVVIRPQTRCYSFNEFEDATKVYVPDNKGKGKFTTNCNNNHIGGLHSLPETGDLLVISKSYKDCRVLRNQGLNSVWFQNEGMIPDEDYLIPLLERFQRYVVFFDNDETGIKSSKIVSDHINSIFPTSAWNLYLPEELNKFNISDPADFIFQEGREKLREFLTKKGLLDGTDTRDSR